MINFNNIQDNISSRNYYKKPCNVAVLGAGWFGKGLINEINRIPGMEPRIVFDRTLDKAVEAFLEAGIAKKDIIAAHSRHELLRAVLKNKYIACDNTNLIQELPDIDVFFDTTGNILMGAQSAVWVLNQGIHYLTVSAEMDSTVGYMLHKIASQNGVVFSNSDGDQPGVLMKMINEIKWMGFEIVVAGNCKGFIDCHKTPEEIMPWVRPGHNPRMITSFTDGTKQSMELTVLANATGLVPDKRGMHGPKSSKETLVDDFLKLIGNVGVVDYTLGINGVNQGAGVFVVAKRTGKKVNDDMEYLKKGVGPYYLFFKDEHLCYFEATKTIAQAAWENKAAIAPKGVYADTVAIAKKDLKKGEQLDGIGGHTVYGTIEKAKIAREENLLPVGLAEYARLKRNVAKDTPITYDMVEFTQDNKVISLRKKQDDLLKSDQPKSNIRIKILEETIS